jgi:hypothetical protein
MRRVLLPFATLTAAQKAGQAPVVGGSGCITWHSTYETTGSAAAAYSLYDSVPGSNQELMAVTLSAGQSTRDYIGLHALSYLGALYLVVTTGSVGGTIQVWADHVCEDWYRRRWEMEVVEAAAAAGALS